MEERIVSLVQFFSKEIAKDTAVENFLVQLDAIKIKLEQYADAETDLCPTDAFRRFLEKPFKQYQVNDILEIHEYIELADYAGCFRTQDVGARFGNEYVFRFCSPNHIEKRLEHLLNMVSCADIHPCLESAIALLEFTDIHPFFDGNGRAGRLWVNIHLIQNGYPPYPARPSPTFTESLKRALAVYSIHKNPKPFCKLFLTQQLEVGRKLLQQIPSNTLQK